MLSYFGHFWNLIFQNEMVQSILNENKKYTFHYRKFLMDLFFLKNKTSPASFPILKFQIKHKQTTHNEILKNKNIFFFGSKLGWRILGI